MDELNTWSIATEIFWNRKDLKYFLINIFYFLILFNWYVDKM